MNLILFLKQRASMRRARITALQFRSLGSAWPSQEKGDVSLPMLLGWRLKGVSSGFFHLLG